MKSKLITVFIITALSTIGLCSTISHASENNEFFIKSTVASNFYRQPVVNVTPVNVINSKHVNTLNLDTVDHILNKPLFSLSSPLLSGYTQSKKYKKNELFELAALFNDKLQQILAFFESTRSAKQNNYIHSDKPDDNTSIKLMSDCKTKEI